MVSMFGVASDDDVPDVVTNGKFRVEFTMNGNYIIFSPEGMDDKWKQCRKLPIVVEFREVMPNEDGVETLEGYKPCDPAIHYIMKGIKGEIYPIAKGIFHDTYEVLDDE